MKSKLLFAGAILLAGVAGSADAFTSTNGQRVNQASEAVFEVVARGRSRTNDYWCSASEFARRVLGAGWRDQIYVVRGYGPSVTTGRRTAVQFTLDPQAAGVTPLDGGVIVSGWTVGDGMSIQRANGFCEPGPIRF